MHIWHLRIRASSLQFRANKINMALARMDKLVKNLMSNPALTTGNFEHCNVVHFSLSGIQTHNISSHSEGSLDSGKSPAKIVLDR
jgi:hypothetical protein